MQQIKELNRKKHADSQQNGSLQMGASLPQPRFTFNHDYILDNLTDLGWAPTGNSTEKPLTWQQALDFITSMFSQPHQLR